MMKKSKLWAKFKIREELHRWWGVEGGIDEDGIDDVLKIIEQIEEPEVLSQEWIHENKEMYLINDTSENAVPDYKLQNLLVPEQELPVIPKFVAEWITNHREKFDLYPALKKLEGNPFGWERTYEWYRVNTHEFVNVYLTGEYEVEEEPLYYALVKGHELIVDKDDWTFKYWKTDTSNGRVFPSHRLINHSDFLTEMTKEDWNKLGINESNADFVEVDEELN